MDPSIQVVDKPWITSGTITGEGPLHTSDGSLVFVDLVGKKLLRCRVNTDASNPTWESHHVPEGPALLAEIDGQPNKCLVGVKAGFAEWDWETATMTPLVSIWGTDATQAQRFRMNDGAVDCRGRMWAGSMVDTAFPDDQGNWINLFEGSSKVDIGSLWRLDSNLSLHEIDAGFIIPNGIGWNLDNTVMYFIESVSCNVYAYDFDAPTGAVSNKRVIYHHKGAGVPDGLAVDVEGCIWVAFYGGNNLLRISPGSGSIVGEIRLPPSVSVVTCACFGGPSMDELFITTGIPENETIDEQGLKGAVYRVKVAVPGVPKNKFRLA